MTNWYKSDDLDHQIVNARGIAGVKLELCDNSTNLVKRNDIAAEFNVNGTRVLYTPQMYNAAINGTSDIVLFGVSDDSGVPMTLLEANNNDTWIINLLTVLDHQPRDYLDSTLYISGSGSMIIECRYGAGKNHDSTAVDNWINVMNNAKNINTLMSATHILY